MNRRSQRKQSFEREVGLGTGVSAGIARRYEIEQSDTRKTSRGSLFPLFPPVPNSNFTRRYQEVWFRTLPLKGVLPDLLSSVYTPQIRDQVRPVEVNSRAWHVANHGWTPMNTDARERKRRPRMNVNRRAAYEGEKRSDGVRTAGSDHLFSHSREPCFV